MSMRLMSNYTPNVFVDLLFSRVLTLAIVRCWSPENRLVLPRVFNSCHVILCNYVIDGEIVEVRDCIWPMIS